MAIKGGVRGSQAKNKACLKPASNFGPHLQFRFFPEKKFSDVADWVRGSAGFGRTPKDPPPPQGCIGMGEAPPPPLQAPSVRPATVSLMPNASCKGIYNRQEPPQTALATSSNCLSKVPFLLMYPCPPPPPPGGGHYAMVWAKDRTAHPSHVGHHPCRCIPPPPPHWSACQGWGSVVDCHVAHHGSAMSLPETCRRSCCARLSAGSHRRCRCTLRRLSPSPPWPPPHLRSPPAQWATSWCLQVCDACVPSIWRTERMARSRPVRLPCSLATPLPPALSLVLLELVMLCDRHKWRIIEFPTSNQSTPPPPGTCLNFHSDGGGTPPPWTPSPLPWTPSPPPPPRSSKSLPPPPPTRHRQRQTT